MKRFGLALLLCLGLAQQSSAGESARRLLDEGESTAWRGVGRLNIAGTRFCTATLISERLALTAAHCLYNPRTKLSVPLRMIHFVAGLRMGSYAASRRIVRAATLPDYAYDGNATATRISTDIALLELETPIEAQTIAPFKVDRPQQRSADVTLVSYARDRAYAPSIEEDCRIKRTRGPIAALSCDVTFGASGAPVLADIDGDMRLIAVISARGNDRDGAMALAVFAEPALDILLGELDRAPVRHAGLPAERLHE